MIVLNLKLLDPHHAMPCFGSRNLIQFVSFAPYGAPMHGKAPLSKNSVPLEGLKVLGWQKRMEEDDVLDNSKP